MSSYRVDCGSMASKHEAWLGVPWGMRHPGGQFGALQAIRGHVILSEIVPKVAIVRLQLKHSSARIPLKVSVLNSLHGVGQGQMIRRGKLGNAIWRERGHWTSQEANSQVIWTRGLERRDDEWPGCFCIGWLVFSPLNHHSTSVPGGLLRRFFSRLSLTLLIGCFKFNDYLRALGFRMMMTIVSKVDGAEKKSWKVWERSLILVSNSMLQLLSRQVTGKQTCFLQWISHQIMSLQWKSCDLNYFLANTTENVWCWINQRCWKKTGRQYFFSPRYGGIVIQ